MTDVYVCRETAAFEWGGDMIVVHKGVTRVRAGHPMLGLHPDLFEPIGVHYDVERATAAPGEKRALSTQALPVTPKPPDALDALRTHAEEVGVTVDKRWGADRIQQEIDKATSGK